MAVSVTELAAAVGRTPEQLIAEVNRAAIGITLSLSKTLTAEEARRCRAALPSSAPASIQISTSGGTPSATGRAAISAIPAIPGSTSGGSVPAALRVKAPAGPNAGSAIRLGGASPSTIPAAPRAKSQSVQRETPRVGAPTRAVVIQLESGNGSYWDEILGLPEVDVLRQIRSGDHG